MLQSAVQTKLTASGIYLLNSGGAQHSRYTCTLSSIIFSNSVSNIPLAATTFRIALSSLAESIYDTLQYVQRRKSSHTSAVERQQTKPCAIERVWLSALLGRRCSLQVPGNT